MTQPSEAPIARSDTLYETEDAFGKVRALRDPDDEVSLPIGLIVGHGSTHGVAWLSQEKANALAQAILDDIGVPEPPDDFNTAAIRFAQQHDVPVFFRYAKGDGSVLESRRVQPVVSVEEHQGDLIAVGFDKDRDDYRAFRLDRIRGRVQVGG